MLHEAMGPLADLSAALGDFAEQTVSTRDIDKIFAARCSEAGLDKMLQEQPEAQVRAQEGESQLSDRALKLQASIAAGGKRWPPALEKDFRAFLSADATKQNEYSELGKAYSAQRDFKMKWLQSEYAAATKQLVHDELHIDTQANI